MSNPKMLSQYPAEFHDIWRLAIGPGIALRFPKQSQAMGMKHRLYSFRKRLATEQGPIAAEKLYAIDLLIEQNPNGEGVILKSGKIEWKRQVADQLGLTRDSDLPPQVEPLEPTSSESSEPMDTALDNYLKT